MQKYALILSLSSMIRYAPAVKLGHAVVMEDDAPVCLFTENGLRAW
jgi:hypothetical protein